MNPVRRERISALACWLISATVFLSTNNFWISLSLASLGVFLWISSGSFTDIPEKAVDSSGKKISPERIKEYRENNPGATISQAIHEINKI